MVGFVEKVNFQDILSRKRKFVFHVSTYFVRLVPPGNRPGLKSKVLRGGDFSDLPVNYVTPPLRPVNQDF